ncbi:ricin-type beta-trefoil lectin domain protein [Streptomyces sp. NPDC046197]|uniref:ricin-type beta-trefoil lectin domain protein n=1 Tax=Streptomyces sp. NPDC046197 TaxID=3154337 RepID=UPI0033C75566
MNAPGLSNSPKPPRPFETTDEQLSAELRKWTGATPALHPVGELLDRHWEAAFAYARLCTDGPRPAGMLTTAAFTRLFGDSLRQSGPGAAWRPQLLVTVRRIAAEWGADHRREMLHPDLVSAAADGDRIAARLLPPTGRRLLSRAFQRLPQTGRALLWHTEVEAEPLVTPAGLLGLDEEAARVELRRARERLREELLQAHRELAPEQDCLRYFRLLDVTYRRGGVHVDPDLDQHLAGCAHCRYTADQLGQFNTDLGTALAEGMLGWGARAYRELCLGGVEAAAPATDAEPVETEPAPAPTIGELFAPSPPAAPIGGESFTSARSAAPTGGEAFASAWSDVPTGEEIFTSARSGAPAGEETFASAWSGAPTGGETSASGWSAAPAGGEPFASVPLAEPVGGESFTPTPSGEAFVPGPRGAAAVDEQFTVGAPAALAGATASRVTQAPAPGRRTAARRSAQQAARRAARRNLTLAVATVSALVVLPLVLWSALGSGDGPAPSPDGHPSGTPGSASGTSTSHPSRVGAGKAGQGTLRGRLHNVASGLCVGIVGKKAVKGAETELATCSSTPGQQWVYETDGLLRSAAAPDLCLDSHLGYSVQLAPCTGAAQPGGANVRYDFTLQGTLVPRFDQNLALTPAATDGAGALVLKNRAKSDVQRWTIDTSQPDLRMEMVNWGAGNGTSTHPEPPAPGPSRSGQPSAPATPSADATPPGAQPTYAAPYPTDACPPYGYPCSSDPRSGWRSGHGYGSGYGRRGR